MRSLSALLLTVFAMTGVANAGDAVVACPPVAAASQAASAPASPKERQAANVKAAGADRSQGTVLPQVAVHMKRGDAEATALKPGKQPTKPANQVDDSAARCQAARP